MPVSALAMKSWRERSSKFGRCPQDTRPVSAVLKLQPRRRVGLDDLIGAGILEPGTSFTHGRKHTRPDSELSCQTDGLTWMVRC